MKVLAFNGSPRKNWNTATLLNKALEGAASQGAETELIHIYDLNIKGCKACNACKTINGSSYGKCVIHDDLTPIYNKIEEADVVLFGSPVYLGRESGEMAIFLERLLFPYLVYSEPPQSLFPKKMNTGLIYTMNVTEEGMKEYGFNQHLVLTELMLRSTFGSAESLLSFYTLQTDDYSKVLNYGDPEKKVKRHIEEFPNDCKKAFDMGVRLTVDKTIVL